MKKFLLAFAMLMLLGSAAKAESLKSMIGSQHFTFVAYRINSSLTNEDPRFATLNELRYTMDITKKWLNCKFPFVGKVYRSAMNDQHIEIDTGQFTYEYKEVKRRKATNIVIKITARSADDNDKYTMTLVVGESGDATLTVSSNYRETVSYLGKIIPLKLYR